ncbi:PrgI family protein [Sedimentibacter sp. MB35-C1]|uniref:PrgI family protein n=1 Tax=Sedimentibacter sp. MB35-C1 TaxID=3070995 RepID=UPI0027DF3E74|nr:PrgI family protein [Sedimentibacter sp. MB35-C1]WMJ77850.1 PrgI family protein [Sedimentibacter sp. MB35-C1]
MIEIKIPKEIRDYREAIFAGLNLRQIISLAVAVAINVPLYVYIKPYIGDEIASWLVIITGIPIFLIGFIKFDGMPFEEYFKVILRFYFLKPRKRKYKVENIYTFIYEHQKRRAEEEIRQHGKRKGGKKNAFKKK